MKARLGPIFMHFRPIPTMIRAKPSVLMVFSQVVSANVLKLIFNTLARIILTFNGVRTIRAKLLHPISKFLSCWSRLTCDTTKLQTLLRTEVIQSPQLKLVFRGKKSPVQGYWWALGLKHQTVGANLLKQNRLISWILHAAMLVKVQNSWGSPPTEPERLRNWIHEGPLMITSSRVSDAFYEMFKYMSWLWYVFHMNIALHEDTEL